MHQGKKNHHLSAGKYMVSAGMLLVFLIRKAHPLKGMLYRNHKIFTEIYQRKCVLYFLRLPATQHMFLFPEASHTYTVIHFYFQLANHIVLSFFFRLLKGSKTKKKFK